ncbi:hypothetical protein D3C72_2084820 [compost metagenome]
MAATMSLLIGVDPFRISLTWLPQGEYREAGRRRPAIRPDGGNHRPRGGKRKRPASGFALGRGEHPFELEENMVATYDRCGKRMGLTGLQRDK